MKCLVCKNTRFDEGTTTMTFERDKAILVVTDVPARLCANCGEPYLREATAREIETLTKNTFAGQVNFRARIGDHEVYVEEYAA